MSTYEQTTIIASLTKAGFVIDKIDTMTNLKIYATMVNNIHTLSNLVSVGYKLVMMFNHNNASLMIWRGSESNKRFGQSCLLNDPNLIKICDSLITKLLNYGNDEIEFD